MNTLKDEELAVLVKKKDSAEAFDELLRRYRSVIYSIAGRIFYSDNIQHATKYEAILEGESALGLAIVNYDRLKGNFKGYAVRCIQGAVMNYVNGNRCLSKPLALQRRLQKVKTAIRTVEDSETADVDIARVRCYLIQKYPDEAMYWERFLEDYIIDIASHCDDISLDSHLRDGISVQEVVAGSLETDRPAEKREISGWISGILMEAWLKVIRKEIKPGNKRRLEILYRYYVRGDSAEEIIRWLDDCGFKGYDLFRQVKSRGFRQLCKKYKDIFMDMVAYLNRKFNRVFIGDGAEGFCDELKTLLQVFADNGVLAEGYDAQS